MAIEQSGHQYSKPDSLLGYGIPDFGKADKYLKVNSLNNQISEQSWFVSPNPFNDYLLVKNINSDSAENCIISIFNLQGIQLWQSAFKTSEQILLNNLSILTDGFLILTIRSGGKEERFKLIKTER